jgi:GNAT superfamily N-acetyltransferase
MDTVLIRLAHRDDRDALCRLYHEFHEFHVRGVPERLISLGEPPKSHRRSDLYMALGGIIKDEDSVIFVAELPSGLVGLAEVHARQEEPNPLRVSRRHGHLQSLIVSAAFRRKGIGAQLLRATQQWAKEKDCVEMRVETWEFERGPLRFYERAHYRTLRRTLVREL